MIRTVGPPNAKMMIVGEVPEEPDKYEGRAFCGPQGKLLQQLLRQAGIHKTDCLVTTVARIRPPAGDTYVLFRDKKWLEPTEHMVTFKNMLREDILKYNPNVILALGELALWALTSARGIGNLRGTFLPCTLVSSKKVIPTFSPRSIQSEHSLSFPVVMDIRKAISEMHTPYMPEEKRTLVVDPPLRDWLDYCDFLANDDEVKYIGADIETTPPNSHVNRMGFAHSEDFAMSFGTLSGKVPTLPERDEVLFWNAMHKVATCGKGLIFQNALYDTTVLWLNNGIPFYNIWMDTLVAAHVLWPEQPKDLGHLASICLKVPAWKGTMKESPGLYNAADAANTFGIAMVLDPLLDQSGTRTTFDLEMSQIPVASYLQLRGININKETKERILLEAKTKTQEALNNLNTLTGKTINYNSPKQLSELLYGALGLPTQYKRRTAKMRERKVTTDANTLQKLQREYDHPILDLILEYRKWTKLLQTIDVPISPVGKAHTSYNITATETGRWSSSKSIILPYGSGNLQNINSFVREMYEPPPGQVMLQADYKQAEAVVVAFLIGDTGLKRIFMEGGDVHKYTASNMFGVDIADVTKIQRKVGKTLRHAVNYCVSEDTEVLTKEGWIEIRYLKKDQEIAQWDKDGSITFITPSEFLRFPFKGQMYSFSQKTFRQTVSPGHRMPTLEHGVKTSDQIWTNFNADIRVPTSGIYTPEDPLQQLTPDFIRLFVAIQADGSYRARGEKREITFYFKKERKIQRLISLLNNLDIKFSTYATSEDRTAFYIGGNRYRWLFDFIDLTGKSFGNWILRLTQESLDALVDESKWWDSRRNVGDTTWQYYSKHRQNCEWMATAAHLTGRRAVLSDSHPTVWTTSISPKDRVEISRSKRTKLNYDSYIYSLVVPSSFYLIRKDDVISVTGNSAGPQVVADKLMCKLSEAKKLLQMYMNSNPLLLKWQREIQAKLHSDRTLVTPLGRKRVFMGRLDDSTFRAAYAFVPQSTVGDLLNMALVRLYDDFNHDIMLQLHDAMYLAVDNTPSAIMEGMRTLHTCMVDRIQPIIVHGEEMWIGIDFKLGSNWKEMLELRSTNENPEISTKEGWVPYTGKENLNELYKLQT